MKYEELLYFWFRTMAHDVGQLHFVFALWLLICDLINSDVKGSWAYDMIGWFRQTTSGLYGVRFR
jgi:hypothetical protein